jgi:hypothetical protein
MRRGPSPTTESAPDAAPGPTSFLPAKEIAMSSESALIETEDSAEEERLRVFRWRCEELRRAGYDPKNSIMLAVGSEVDRQLALDLLALGCPHETALRILLYTVEQLAAARQAIVDVLGQGPNPQSYLQLAENAQLDRTLVVMAATRLAIDERITLERADGETLVRLQQTCG